MRSSGPIYMIIDLCSSSNSVVTLQTLNLEEFYLDFIQLLGDKLPSNFTSVPCLKFSKWNIFACFIEVSIYQIVGLLPLIRMNRHKQHALFNFQLFVLVMTIIINHF